MPEIKAKSEPKAKGLRTQKIYTLKPKFNRVIRQQTQHNRNTVFYTIYTAGLELLIYNNP
jgi:hypothetical protein